MKNKNVVLYGVIALVAVVAIAFFTGRIPPKGNVEGTIGGANRYQSQQIAEQDVVLKDAQVQAFLQSDLFHKIQTNPELAKAIQEDANFRMAFKEASFGNAIADENFLATVRKHTEALAAAASTEGFAIQLRRRELQQILTAADASKVTTAEEFQTLIARKKEFAAVLASEEYAKVADKMAALCADAQARAAFRNQEVLNWLSARSAMGAENLNVMRELSQIPAAGTENLALALKQREMMTLVNADQLVPAMQVKARIPQ